MSTMHRNTFGGTGELMCSPDLLAAIREPKSKGRERKWRRERKCGRDGSWREGKGER